jgi:hypothetical protein
VALRDDAPIFSIDEQTVQSKIATEILGTSGMGGE